MQISQFLNISIVLIFMLFLSTFFFGSIIFLNLFKNRLQNCYSLNRLTLIHIFFSPVLGFLFFSFIIIYLAPIFGSSIPQIVMGLLFVVSFVVNLYYVRNNLKDINFYLNILLIFLFVAFLIYFNSLDLLSIGSYEYFPRTNADTFSYISHAEQFLHKPINLLNPLRQRYEDLLVYPAGYEGYYAPYERNAVSLLLAMVAKFCDLETHQVFFAFIRFVLLLTILTFFSLLLFLRITFTNIFFTLIIFIFGCFSLQSIMQQFLSASVGVIFSLMIFIFLLLCLKNNYKKRDSFFLGIVCGLFFIHSPESSIVYFPSLFAFFTFTLLKNGLIEVKRFLPILYGFILGSLPLIFDPISVINLRFNDMHQFQVDYEYTFENIIGFALNIFGLRPGVQYQPESSFELIFLFLISIFFTITFLYFLRSFYLFLNKKNVALINTKEFEFEAFIFLVFTTYISFLIYFYITKSSYMIYKMIDYFTFFPVLLIAFTFVIFNKYIRKMKYFVSIAFFLTVCLFVNFSIKHRISLFGFYEKNILDNPQLSSFDISKFDLTQVKTIAPILTDFNLELFYYVNRNKPVKINVYEVSNYGPNGSWRYIQKNEFKTSVSHIFCTQYSTLNITKLMYECGSSPDNHLIKIDSWR